MTVGRPPSVARSRSADEAEQSAEDLVVVLAEHRRRRCGPSGRRLAKRNGSDGCRRHADHRVVDDLVVAAGDVLRVLRREAGVDRRRRRDPGRRAAGRRPCRASVSAAHAASVSSSRSCCARRPAWVAQRGIGRPVGPPEHVDERRPLRRRSPPTPRATARASSVAYTPCGAAHGLRLPSRSTACAVRGPLDDRLGRDVERGLEHGRLDQRADAGAVAQLEGDERADHRVHAAVRVARTALDAGLVVDVTGEPGQPGHLLHGLREAGPVAPRAVEAERGHAHQHRARVGRVDDVPTETELLEHPRREVLDHDVALLRSGAGRGRDPRARARSRVRSRLLVFEVWKKRAVLPPLVVIHADAAGVAHAVGPGDRLDVDDVGAERGEHRRRRRSRPPGGEVDHLDRPASGSSGARVAGGFAVRGTTLPVCSPSRGAGAAGAPPRRRSSTVGAARGTCRSDRRPRSRARRPARRWRPRDRRTPAPPGCAARRPRPRPRRSCAWSSTRG